MRVCGFSSEALASPLTTVCALFGEGLPSPCSLTRVTLSHSGEGFHAAPMQARKKAAVASGPKFREKTPKKGSNPATPIAVLHCTK